MNWFTWILVFVCVLANLEARFANHGVTGKQRLKYVKTQLTTVAINVVMLGYIVLVHFNLNEFKTFDDSPLWFTHIVFACLYIGIGALTVLSWHAYMHFRPVSFDQGKDMAGIKVKK